MSPGLAPAAAPVAAHYTFAFQDADVAQVAEEVLGRTLNIAYALDATANVRMTFRIDQRLTRRQLLEAFETALASSDLVMVRQGESLLITSRGKARSAVGVSGAGRPSGQGGYQSVTVPLTYVTPSEAAKALASLGPANVVLLADDKTGVIVLGGSERELEAAMQTLKVFDNAGMKGSKVRWFPLANASAQTVTIELGQVLKASGVSANVVPMRRLNGLYAFANTDGALEEVAKWVERLDRSSEPENGRLWVYHPKNVTAENLGRTLTGLFGGGAQDVPAEPPTPAAGTADRGSPGPTVSIPAARDGRDDQQVRISVDRESNSVVISAPASERAQIEKILREIDVSPGQVLVEASILEVTLGNDRRLGVDWSVLADAGKLRVTSTSDSAGGVSPSYPGFAITFIDDDIRAAVDALDGRNDVQVVSTPRIVVLDNRTAKLQIGNQVPVVTETSQSNAAVDAPRVVTIDYRDTGVILEVTPRISGEDRVTLNIAQEVSAVARTTTSGIDSPTIQQRRMESTLRLRSGDTVALGGLISSSLTNGDSGVPLLKDVPVLGALFKSSTKEKSRTELIVLITVRVLPTDQSSDAVMSDILADLVELRARGLLPES